MLKKNLQEIGSEGVNWMQLAQDLMVGFVSTVMKL
jgi:hypothetical protein